MLARREQRKRFLAKDALDLEEQVRATSDGWNSNGARKKESSIVGNIACGHAAAEAKDRLRFGSSLERVGRRHDGNEEQSTQHGG